MKSNLDGALAFNESDAVKATGIKRPTLVNQRLSGRIKAIRCGRSWLYLRDDLLALLREYQKVGRIEAPTTPDDRERLAELNRARRAQREAA